MKINLKNYVMLETFDGLERILILRCRDCGEESRINDRLFVDVPLLSSIEANHECVKEVSFKEAKRIVEEGK